MCKLIHYEGSWFKVEKELPKDKCRIERVYPDCPDYDLYEVYRSVKQEDWLYKIAIKK